MINDANAQANMPRNTLDINYESHLKHGRQLRSQAIRESMITLRARIKTLSHSSANNARTTEPAGACA